MGDEETSSGTTHKQGLLDTLRAQWGGGMNWEIGTDIYTLLILCIK